MSKNTKTTPVNFRLPHELDNWLSKEAKREHRSKSGQLVHILAQVANITQTANKAV